MLYRAAGSCSAQVISNRLMWCAGPELDGQTNQSLIERNDEISIKGEGTKNGPNQLQ